MRVIGALWITAGAFAAACATPRDDGSKAQGLEDTTQMQYMPQEGKFFVVCREGRSHRGAMSALVTKEELDTVCEGPQLVDSELEAGTPQGVQPDITSCDTLSAESRNIDVAFTPQFVNEHRQLAPVVAKQKLCVGAVNVVNTLTKNNQMLGLLIGDVLGAPVLVVIDLPTGAVKFDETNMILTVPSKIDALVQQSIETELAGHNITFCGQPYIPTTSPFGNPVQNPNLLVGKRVDGICWILGTFNKSCAVTCADAEMQYDVRTMSAAGSGGTNDACKKLAANWDLNWKGQDVDCLMSGFGVGCHMYSNEGVRRCTGQPTTAEAKNITAKRFCACR